MGCCIVSATSYCICEEQEKQTFMKMSVNSKMASFSTETQAWGT